MGKISQFYNLADDEIASLPVKDLTHKRITGWK